MKNTLSRTHLVYLGLASMVFIGLKLLFRQAGLSFFHFLLVPVDFLVSMLSGSDSSFIPGTGYYHEAPGFTIDKSCSGYNLWLLSFVMLTYLMVRYAKSHSRMFMAIPYALLVTYGFTVIANASRILISITFEPLAQAVSGVDQTFIHEGTGIATNLTFLILLYLLTEALLRSKNTYAKTA
ncbi:MAG: exosortase K [Cyclobacteriaceae bacterium]